LVAIKDIKRKKGKKEVILKFCLDITWLWLKYFSIFEYHSYFQFIKNKRYHYLL